MEPVLYGPLGLTPPQAEALTPSDVRKLYAGYHWRQERRMDHLAVLMSAIYQAAGGKTKVKKILGREFGDSLIPGYRKAPPPPSIPKADLL